MGATKRFLEEKTHELAGKLNIPVHMFEGNAELINMAQQYAQYRLKHPAYAEVKQMLLEEPDRVIRSLRELMEFYCIVKTT